MSLPSRPIESIPEETARIARAAFPKRNLYMKMRDELGTIYQDEPFADIFPTRGQPAEAPWRLALVTVMQFAEGLSDRQASDAVRSRIDWKYALGLELSDAGFDSSVLSEFRTRLLAQDAAQRLFDQMLECLKGRGLLKARGRQRTDSTHVLAAVRSLNRVECIGETLRYALNTLAQASPEWLLGQISSEWFDRYSKRFENYRLPREKAEREALALSIGHDGWHLLCALWTEQAPPTLRHLPAVETLRRVWVQQFGCKDEALYLRQEGDMPAGAMLIRSPYDDQARYSVKRETHWTGYKVHLTETCEEDAPHLITHVLTTPATTADSDATAPIQEELAQAGLLPTQQLVDEGYTDAALLVESHAQHGVELLGPVARDASWQAREGQGFDITRFAVDWQKQQATCPNGKSSEKWQPARNARGGTYLRVVFARADCAGCEQRPLCTRAQSVGRTLYLHPQVEYEALHEMRQRQETAAFRKAYAPRAGIEGTLSQGIRGCALRRSRYAGQAKTHLQNLAIATALNLERAVNWLWELPLATTRRSCFAALRPSMAQPTPTAA